MTGPIHRLEWTDIRRDLLARIQTGVWKPGDSIPREVELATQYGCTRSTVGRALRDLATAGFLERRRKGGTTVSANPVRKAPLDVPIIADAINKSGKVSGYQLLACRSERPPRLIRARLGVGAQAALVFIAALYRADGVPHQLEHRWLVPAAVPGLEAEILERTPVDEWLLQNAPLTRATIEIEAVGAPVAVADALQMPVGAATLLVTRQSWTQAQPIGFLHLYHAPGVKLSTAI
ncbi:GntR family histidine utilization transcriptional repressor [Roseovarius sp. MBR-51]